MFRRIQWLGMGWLVRQTGIRRSSARCDPYSGGCRVVADGGVERSLRENRVSWRPRLSRRSLPHGASRVAEAMGCARRR
jgi:hypothetical protein